MGKNIIFSSDGRRRGHLHDAELPKGQTAWRLRLPSDIAGEGDAGIVVLEPSAIMQRTSLIRKRAPDEIRASARPACWDCDDPRLTDIPEFRIALPNFPSQDFVISGTVSSRDFDLPRLGAAPTATGAPDPEARAAQVLDAALRQSRRDALRYHDGHAFERRRAQWLTQARQGVASAWEDVLDEHNAEVSALMMSLYGWERALHEGRLERLQYDECGELFRMPSLGAAVRVRNSTPEPDGTYKHYVLPVPPEMRTAREAVAWTFGMSAEEYQPAVET